MNNSDENIEETVKEKSIAREIVSTIIYILIVLLISFITIRFIGQRTQVSGQSMENTLHDKDNLIVDKITYRFTDPKRFDIIVFPYQYKTKTYYIKRIIGLPGEIIQITDGVIYINGEVLEEDYGREIIENSGIAGRPIQLGEDEYFVLGDNRNHSADSRVSDVGTIKRKDIMGRAWVRIWPLNKFGVLKHQ
jgi:signal peptidase I